MSDLQKIVQLQNIDDQLREISNLLGDLPEKVKELHQEEKELVETVEKGEARLKEIELEISKIGLQEAEYKEKIDKHKNQLFLVTNNKQYDALMHEIDHLKAELDQSETKELELREEQSELSESTKSKSMNLDSLREDLHERMGKLEKVIAESDDQKRELEEQRVSQVSGISAGIINKYERVFQARDGVAVVKMVGSACGGCGSVVPPQIVAEIKSRKGIKICDVCSRFIYYPEPKLAE